jgi:L-iditol 2-dehydrogenase
MARTDTQDLRLGAAGQAKAGTMRAAVWHGQGRENFRIEQVSRPAVQDPGDIIIRVRSVAYGAMMVRAITRGHPELTPPTVMGRMIGGDVAGAGRAVGHVAPGMRVTVDPEGPCGACFYCKNGLSINCADKTELDPGGYADYVRVPGRFAANVYPIPEHVSYEHAAYTETLACVAWGILKGGVTFGDTVVVIGCGGVGLTHQQMARLRGAVTVFGVDIVPDAVEAARQSGSIGIDARTEDVQAAVLERTGGRGADVVIEAVGSQPTYETALRLARPGGRVVAFGGSPPRTTMTADPNRIHYAQLEFIGAYHYPPGLFQRSLDLIAAGALDLGQIITHRLPFERIGEAIDVYTRPDCRLLMIEFGDRAEPA